MLPENELRKIEALGLSVRAHNALMRGYGTVENALASDTNPLAVPGLGIHTAEEIALAMKKHGYNIAGTPWDKYLPKQN